MTFIDLAEPTAGTPGSDLIGAVTSAHDGDWLDAGLHTFVAGFDTAAAVVDPLGSMARWGVMWALEHIEPLRSLLDALAGNDQAVTATAAALAGAAIRLEDGAQEPCRIAPGSRPGQGLGGWEGSAAQAWERQRSRLATAERASAAALHACQEQLGRAAVVVTIVRDHVSMLIAEVVVAIARAAAASGLTLGTMTPAAGAYAASKVALAMGRAARRITELIASLARLESMIGSWATAAVHLGRTASRGAGQVARTLPSASELRAAVRSIPETPPAALTDPTLTVMSAIASRPDDPTR